MAGHAAMPETGFAYALDYQVSGDAEAGRTAVAWALGPATNLRQEALVYDWCQDLLSDAQKQQLAKRMLGGIADTESNDSVAAVEARALAAVALFDEAPQIPSQELERMVRGWWEKKIAPDLPAGRSVVPRDDAYALYELLHVLRDTTTLDLRESARTFFRGFPTEHLVSYYPAPFEASENGTYFIGAMRRTGESGPARRGPVARRRTGHGGLRHQRARHAASARLADARPLHAARRLSARLTNFCGPILTSRG